MFSYCIVNVFAWNQLSIHLSKDFIAVIAVEQMVDVMFSLKVSRLTSPLRIRCIIAYVISLVVPLYVPYALHYSLVPITMESRTVIYFQISQFVTEHFLCMKYIIHIL